MGCTQCVRAKEPDVVADKANQNGLKSLFYATNEFDLSRSESDDDEENYSLNSIKNNKRSSTNKIASMSNEFNSTNTTSSTTAKKVTDRQSPPAGV